MSPASSLSEADLAREIRRLADMVGHVPNTVDMDEEGRYAYGTYHRRFDSWDRALQAAGLSRNGHVTDTELLAELQQLAKIAGESPTVELMDQDGKYGSRTYHDCFGSWESAKEAAGVSAYSPREYTNEELLDGILELADKLGRTPTAKEMNTQGPFWERTYRRRFEGWNDALRQAGLQVNQPSLIDAEAMLQEVKRVADEFCRTPLSTEIEDEVPYCYRSFYNLFGSWSEVLARSGVLEEYGPTNEPKKGRVPYGSHWEEQREKAIERDHEQCGGCGLSREEHLAKYNQDIHVHHRRPRYAYLSDPTSTIDDADELSNLVTLCASCHRRWEILPVQIQPYTGIQNMDASN